MANNKIPVSAKEDFMDSLASTKPLNALAELIWNGFDARSNKVTINIDYNGISAMNAIRVRDFGEGIKHSHIQEYFGNLGDSWKKIQRRHGDRMLHGKNGRGRFKAFALGGEIKWQTCYSDGSDFYTYSIVGKKGSLNEFSYTDPSISQDRNSGTEVTISELHRDFRSLERESVVFDLAKLFAMYLTEYPHISLVYNNENVAPELVQDRKTDYLINDFSLSAGRKINLSISVIEWKTETDRRIYLCDSKGVAYHDFKPKQKIRARGFHFTVYVKSDYFRELDEANRLGMEELDTDINEIMTPVWEQVQKHFRDRELENKGMVVEEWKAENIYPYDDDIDTGPIETAERQVFNILAVNVQNYLPSFGTFENRTKKFTFKLLAQAIRENPFSVQKIINEVLELKREEQDEFAGLLEKTSLSSIISSSKIVADRLNFLHGFEDLIFNPSTKWRMLERDQLHKMLEKEPWIFGDEFYLTASEERLEGALLKHRHIIEPDYDEDEALLDDQPVLLPDGKTGRIDLFLSKVRHPRSGEFDHLVVELKRPSKKIDDTVVTQIKNYAKAVSNDERFNSIKVRWKFLAVSNELSDPVKDDANQKNRERGLIYESSDSNITVWVYEWAELINSAKSRLQFFSEQLKYIADKDSAQKYLSEVHAKFIPMPNANKEESDADEEDSGKS